MSTTWGHVDCPNCGRRLEVVETKNQRATIYCAPGDGCGYRAFYNENRESWTARGHATTATETKDGPKDQDTGKDDEQLQEQNAPAGGAGGDSGGWIDDIV